MARWPRAKLQVEPNVAIIRNVHIHLWFWFQSPFSLSTGCRHMFKLQGNLRPGIRSAKTTRCKFLQVCFHFLSTYVCVHETISHYQFPSNGRAQFFKVEKLKFFYSEICINCFNPSMLASSIRLQPTGCLPGFRHSSRGSRVYHEAPPWFSDGGGTDRSHLRGVLVFSWEDRRRRVLRKITCLLLLPCENSKSTHLNELRTTDHFSMPHLSGGFVKRESGVKRYIGIFTWKL